MVMNYVVNPDVIFSKVDGEAVLLDMKTGLYFGLDEVATLIWEMLKENKSITEIIKHIVDQFNVDEKIVERDLINFINVLKDKSLIKGE
jgi:hypothetical protein